MSTNQRQLKIRQRTTIINNFSVSYIVISVQWKLLLFPIISVRFSDAKPEEIPEMHHESDTPRETPEAEPESRKDRLRRKRRANIQMTP